MSWLNLTQFTSAFFWNSYFPHNFPESTFKTFSDYVPTNNILSSSDNANDLYKILSIFLAKVLTHYNFFKFQTLISSDDVMKESLPWHVTIFYISSSWAFSFSCIILPISKSHTFKHDSYAVIIYFSLWSIANLWNTGSLGAFSNLSNREDFLNTFTFSPSKLEINCLKFHLQISCAVPVIIN